MVALICASETIPVKEKVGVAAMLSEKVAVIVTTSELETILSESVSVKVTVTVFERTNSISSKKVVFPFEEEVVSNWIQRGVFSSIPEIVAISNNLDFNSIKSAVFENDLLSAIHESSNTGASK